jgi:hypothetical protein
MVSWQSLLLVIFLSLQIILFIKSRQECKNGCSFTLTHWLAPLGMFVWGDVLVLSLFWFFAGLVALLLQDVVLFLLIVSTFWLVRSIGETIYWFHQQFATVKRDLPHTLLGYSLVKNEAIWFMYQVMWQCVTVVTLLTTIYLSHQWLTN